MLVYADNVYDLFHDKTSFKYVRQFTEYECILY